MRIGAIALVFSAGLAYAGPEEPPVAATHWQLPDVALGARLAPILLLSRADVQLELGLTTGQVEQARRAIADLHARAAAIQGRSGPDAVASRRGVDEAARRWIDEHLDDQQRARLEQLDLQWEGASALLTRPTIAASLGLTEEQHRQIAESIALQSPPGEGPVDRHRRLHREAARCLTDEQRKRWVAMLGSPFEPGEGTVARRESPSGGIRR